MRSTASRLSSKGPSAQSRRDSTSDSLFPAPLHHLYGRRAARALFHASLSLSVALAGCTVGPDFKKPSAPVFGSYTRSGTTAVSPARADYRQWWSVFHDPTLDRLIDLAYHQNLTLQTVGARVLEARAVLGVAIGGFYPQQQQAGGSIEYDRLSKKDVLSNPFNPVGSFWRLGFGTQISWELDFWGKFRRGIESADAAYLASIATYDDALVSLIGDVASTYVGIRTLQNQIEIARKNADTQRQGLSIAQTQFNEGATSKLDVYQADNVLKNTESVIPQLGIQLQKGYDALTTLLGISLEQLNGILSSSGPIPVAPISISVGIPADLLMRRPDIREAEMRAAAQSARIGMAEADFYPSISLNGSVGFAAATANGAGLGDAFTHDGLFYALGPSLNWNFLNYGRIANNVRAQDAQFQSLLEDYKNTVLRAQQEVNDGLSTFVLSREQSLSLEGSVRAASGALDLAFLQYREGLVDFTTVLTAEQNLLQAENSLAAATGSIASGLVAAYRALGGGWEIREGQDFVTEPMRQQMRDRTDWGRMLPKTGPSKPNPSGPHPGGVFDVPAPEW